MPNLLILSKHADEYRKLVQERDISGLEIFSASRSEQVISAGQGYEIVLGEPSLVREVLSTLTSLRWVQSTWAGVEPLLDPSLRRDYTLTNARGIFGALMSEYVFGYLLAHERRVVEHCQLQLEHRWGPRATGTLHGKVIGLLGVGSIGAHLAMTAKYFGMTVRGYTRASESCPDVDHYYHDADLQGFAYRPGLPHRCAPEYQSNPTPSRCILIEVAAASCDDCQCWAG